MAKFATALCLLLAVCGTQAGFLELIREHIDNNIDNIKAEIEVKKQELAEAIAVIKEKVEEKKQIIEEKVQALIDEAQAKYEEIKANAQETQSCLSYSVDLQASLQAIADNTITCSRNEVAEIEAKYQEVKASLEELTADLVDILEQAAECQNNNIIDGTLCLINLSKNEATEAQEKWAALLEDSADFAASLVGVSDKLQACGKSEYVSTVTSEAQEAYAKFQDCINNENYVAY